MSTDRRAGARLVARRVAARVTAAVPRGLGRWGPAWSLVEAPSRAFLDALDKWEHADDPSDTEEEALRDAVREAGARVIAAWKDAAEAWDAAGRPVEPWTSSAEDLAGRVEVGR